MKDFIVICAADGSSFRTQGECIKTVVETQDFIEQMEARPHGLHTIIEIAKEERYRHRKATGAV